MRRSHTLNHVMNSAGRKEIGREEERGGGRGDRGREGEGMYELCRKEGREIERDETERER